MDIEKVFGCAVAHMKPADAKMVLDYLRERAPWHAENRPPRTLEVFPEALPAVPPAVATMDDVLAWLKLRTLRTRKEKARLRRWKKIEACVRRHLRANPRNTLTYARQLAAKELNLSERTVLRATRNLPM